MKSYAQDLMFGVSRGKIKPPKHVLLPYAVKTLTNNVELVQMLNRCGHGISYSQLEEINTALCLQKMASTSEIPLPDNIQPYVSTTLAWDNIDRLEETLSGEGTSHRVNGIAVQARHFGPRVPTELSPVIAKSKQRSVEPLDVVNPPIYNAGERQGPQPRRYVEVTCQEALENARRKNLLWVLVRLHGEVNQKVSGWTGFNILVRNEVEVCQDNIGYLPTIDAPATNMSTVHEVLVRSLKIKEVLHLKSIVLVFDQALYAKATEIAWKHDKFKDIVIRMGMFHTVCTLLSILGKRFQDAGLRDICIESGVITEGSVSGVLEGRKYNRAIRFHKLMYEALQRLVWEGFQTWIDKFPEKKEFLQDVVISLKPLYNDVCQKEHEKVLSSEMFSEFITLYDTYLEYLRKSNGKLCSFWMSYIDIVEIMLNLSARISRDEADVRSLLAMLEEHWINPISNEQQDIVCLSTGKVATPKIQEDLLNAKAVGEKAYEAFRVQRLETDPPKVKFHDSLKKSKLQTFSELNKKVKVKSKSAKEIILKADRALFAQMIIIAENRKLQMREVLCHPLGPLPWSLSTADGSLRKTTKSTLAKELQKNVPAADIIPEPSACIIDGMALVQRLKGDHKKFSDVADSLLGMVLHEGSSSNRIDVIFDVYRETSIKNAEREQRGSECGNEFRNIQPEHKVQQWRKFLLKPKNKKAFTTFVAKEWQQEKYRKKLTNKVLFVACEEECHQISSESANAVQDLKSTQEEADTRIILHIAHAARSGYDTLIVASEDTDVFILCLTFKDMIPSSIFFKCGMQTRVRYVSISSVAQAIGQDICHSLLGVHAYTGMEWELSDDLFKKLQDFTCHMYCSRPGTNDINELRYSPIRLGWCQEENQLAIDWMSAALPCPALPCPCPALPLPCPALPCPALPCPALPCPALPCPALPCPALPCPALPCPALPCPALPCPALPCPALPCPALPCPALPCPALPCPALPCPALPCPALPCPALPPALPCPALPCPALPCPCPALPCPALPCPALPCPALPCPALPCPALPCPALPCPALPCPALD
ncbi:hypothetical protein QZH41_002521 [Actinostola sp. cb2023]|nr:hypothetical protein QZH41_002521 [Actinostola sp. cb2023]